MLLRLELKRVMRPGVPIKPRSKADEPVRHDSVHRIDRAWIKVPAKIVNVGLPESINMESLKNLVAESLIGNEALGGRSTARRLRELKIRLTHKIKMLREPDERVRSRELAIVRVLRAEEGAIADLRTVSQSVRPGRCDAFIEIQLRIIDSSKIRGD